MIEAPDAAENDQSHYFISGPPLIFGKSKSGQRGQYRKVKENISLSGTPSLEILKKCSKVGGTTNEIV